MKDDRDITMAFITLLLSFSTYKNVSAAVSSLYKEQKGLSIDNKEEDIVEEEKVWRTAVDPNYDKIYYYNIHTRESRWEHPAELDVSDGTGAAGAGGANKGKGKKKDMVAAFTEQNKVRAIIIDGLLEYKKTMYLNEKLQREMTQVERQSKVLPTRFKCFSERQIKNMELYGAQNVHTEIAEQILVAGKILSINLKDNKKLSSSEKSLNKREIERLSELIIDQLNMNFDQT